MDRRAQSPWMVVVADDDDDTRLLMASSFRRAGFEVTEASNGNELLESFAQQTARRVLVVSDIGMPEMDGIAAATAVRRARAETPILLVTAFGDERTLRSARAAGANTVLLKPLDLPLLLRTATALIAAATPGRTAP
jgi:CheY-like chemotaxis protein